MHSRHHSDAQSELQSLLEKTYALAEYTRTRFDSAPIQLAHRSHPDHVENQRQFCSQRDELRRNVKRVLDSHFGPMEYHRFTARLERRSPTVAPGHSPVWKGSVRCRCWWDARDELLEMASHFEELMSDIEQKQQNYPELEGRPVMTTILFLAADPSATAQNRLRLDQEMRAIDEALRKSEFRDRFDLQQQWAVRVTDLQEHLLRFRPDIVHFSGHGSKASEIVLEDASGRPHSVPVRALGRLFSTLRDNIRCVVLNTCYSEKQADAIAQHIDCVVGMTSAIEDSAAIAFSVAFYRALAYGRDVRTAFDLGCGQIDLEGLEEQDIPKLIAYRHDPKKIVIVSPHSAQTSSSSTKSEYRRDRIRCWRDAIEGHDWDTAFGATAWYTEVRPHLKPEIVAQIEAPRTFTVPAEGRGGPAVKYMLLDEVSRIEREWDLI